MIKRPHLFALRLACGVGGKWSGCGRAAGDPVFTMERGGTEDSAPPWLCVSPLQFGSQEVFGTNFLSLWFAGEG